MPYYKFFYSTATTIINKYMKHQISMSSKDNYVTIFYVLL